jgi:act minimal PKS acyl carrier protein
MKKLELTEMVELLRECAGEDELIDLDGDIKDTTFPELGYDSLALLQLAAVVERQYGIELADDVMSAETPQAFLDLVNGVLEEVEAGIAA